MTTEQFTAHYQRYINDLEKIINPSLSPITNQLRQMDIKNHYICQNLERMTEYEARGFVWTLFIRELKDNSFKELPDHKIKS